jgi:hypothetical protein
MKKFVFLLSIVAITSCSELIIKEEIVSEKQLEPLKNYRIWIQNGDENGVSFGVQKVIFDKSQNGPNCQWPLKTEEEFLTVTFSDSSIVKSTSATNIPNSRPLIVKGNQIYNFQTDYNSSQKKLIIKTFSQNLVEISSNSFELISKFSGKYEYADYSKAVPSADGNFFIAANSGSSQKKYDAQIIIAKTKGSGLQYFAEYTFKGNTNVGIWDMIEGKDGSLYVLASSSIKDGNLQRILRLDPDTQKITLEKEFELKNYYFSKILIDKEGNLMFMPTNLDFQKPDIYVYSPADKSIITKSLILENDRTLKLGYNIEYYSLDKQMFQVTNASGESYIAEIGADYKVKTLFKRASEYSQLLFPITWNGNLIMYELQYPNTKNTQEISIVRHRSLTEQQKIVLYSDHAGVSECYRFD